MCVCVCVVFAVCVLGRGRSCSEDRKKGEKGHRCGVHGEEVKETADGEANAARRATKSMCVDCGAEEAERETAEKTTTACLSCACLSFLVRCDRHRRGCAVAMQALVDAPYAIRPVALPPSVGSSLPAFRLQVWGLSEDSAGLFVRFESNAPQVAVRYNLTRDSTSMWHFPSTGASVRKFS